MLTAWSEKCLCSFRGEEEDLESELTAQESQSKDKKKDSKKKDSKKQDSKKKGSKKKGGSKKDTKSSGSHLKSPPLLKCPGDEVCPSL